MKNQPWKYILPVTGMAFVLAGIAYADPLDVTASPASDAAAQIDSKYGIHIVLKGDIDPQKPVTFSLTDADAPGARLQAVNALANAADADFQKTFVVSKAPDSSTNVPSEQIDTNAVVAFPQTKIAAEDAIRRIAGADNAVAQIYGPVGDTVTLSATTLTAKQAAREVADQTHTQWKTFYAMTPRGAHVLAGKVIGRTGNGSPIIEEPYVYYQKKPLPIPQPVNVVGAPNNPQEPGQPTFDSPDQYGNNFGYGPVPYGDPSSAYGYPYGFDTYASGDPYSQNVYPGGPTFGSPYTSGGGYDNGSGLSVTDGYGPPIVFGGGY